MNSSSQSIRHPGPAWHALAIVGCAISLCVGNTLAHHAPFIYDTQTEQVVTGTVIEFRWQQPHTWTEVRTIDARGGEVIWSLEGMHPEYLGRRGWNRHSLQPGDVIEVTFFPRRDGTPTGMFLRARLGDGTVKVMAVNPQTKKD